MKALHHDLLNESTLYCIRRVCTIYTSVCQFLFSDRLVDDEIPERIDPHTINTHWKGPREILTFFLAHVLIYLIIVSSYNVVELSQTG
jgi:hypothetical protein